MSSYKQLYMHLANADGTFNLLELAVLDTALSQYTGKIQSIKSPALYHFRYVLARGVFFVPKNHID